MAHPTIFKFVTEKPSAIAIWTTLAATDIQPNSIYTSDQIRYLMFCILQLSEDFKSAKDLCNAFLAGKLTWIATAFNAVIPNKADGVKNIQPIPADLPQWIDPALYIPYYMSYSILDWADRRFGSLFDRSDRSTLESEFYKVSIENNPEESFTAYNLMQDQFHPSMYSSIFTIDSSLKPINISSLDSLNEYLSEKLYDYLAEGSVFNVGTDRITIPSFRLVQETADEAL